MDYAELVKALRNRRVCIQSGGDLKHDFPLMREAADAIEALQRACANYAEQAEEQEWIPITERLPEKDGKYLTVFKDRCVSTNFFMTPTGEKFKEVHPNGKWYWNEPDRGGITHWMPLPEPPKEEKE